VEVCFEEGLEGVADVGEGGIEALCLIDFPDPGLDFGGFSDGLEEVIRGEPDEPFLAREAGMFGLLKEPCAGIEGEDGIADPREVPELTIVHAIRCLEGVGIVKGFSG